MKTETMRARILDLIEGRPVKMAKAKTPHALICTRQESQLFNLLHREFNAKAMSIRKIEDKRFEIIVRDFDCNVFIRSEIHTR